MTLAYHALANVEMSIAFKNRVQMSPFVGLMLGIVINVNIRFPIPVDVSFVGPDVW